MKNKFKIQVVVGSRKAYNECNKRALGSQRLDLGDFNSLEELIEELKKEGFTKEELEETFTQDIESDGIDFKNGDYINIEKLWEIAEKLDSVEDYDIDKVKALNEVLNLDDVIEKIENDELDDCLLYSDCETFADYAEEIFNETAPREMTSSRIAWYIDFDRMGHDMSINQALYETSYGVLEIC